MKHLICLVILGIFVNSAPAQIELQYKWTITVKATDEDGNPVAAAHIGVGYFNDGPQGINGLTDTNGIYVASRQSTAGMMAYLISFQADKRGYYSTWHQIDLGRGYSPGNWNQTVVLTLKKIVNPIPMYAKSVNLGMPIFDKPVGYDLMTGDWVAPYGKGARTDIAFTGHFDRKVGGESDYTLTVSFPNKGDGIQPFTPTEMDRVTAKAGGLLSSHEAPADSYQPEWLQTDNRKSGGHIQTNRDRSRGYFFRVQTALDKNGNVKSALYGKIYGDFMHFTYYLNPTPNDRNIEFDPEHNLLDGLKPFDQVKNP